ncbi:hypothetical protein PM082_010144 [Marasmius tenuissimus]|nr:hypothetical protein PM082_010144 [Marasmius tenuissimus]
MSNPLTVRRSTCLAFKFKPHQTCNFDDTKCVEEADDSFGRALVRIPTLAYDRGGDWAVISRMTTSFRVTSDLLTSVDNFMSITVVGNQRRKSGLRHTPHIFAKNPPNIPEKIAIQVRHIFDIVMLATSHAPEHSIAITEVVGRAAKTVNSLLASPLVSSFITDTYHFPIDNIKSVLVWWFKSYCLAFAVKEARVQLQQRRRAGGTGQGFTVRARVALKKHEYLYELTGATSEDSYKVEDLDLDKFPYHDFSTKTTSPRFLV